MSQPSWQNPADPSNSLARVGSPGWEFVLEQPVAADEGVELLAYSLALHATTATDKKERQRAGRPHPVGFSSTASINIKLA